MVPLFCINTSLNKKKSSKIKPHPNIFKTESYLQQLALRNANEVVHLQEIIAGTKSDGP
jgi:hypothetical protein